ncbi:hypothetical protein D3C76_1527310 [compost metagenome]
MEGGGILPDNMLGRLFGMVVRGFVVFVFARFLCRPVQQRQVQAAVDDHSALLQGIVQIAPGLDNLRILQVAGHQPVRRLEACFPGFRAAGEPVLGHG